MFYNAPIARTWATTGNSDTITDINISANVSVVINNTQTENGIWKVVVTPTKVNGATLTAGTIVVTSSTSETAGLTYNYKLI